MSFKFHQQALGKICRVCTNRIAIHGSRNLPKESSEYRKELFNNFGISVWEDSPEQHPSKVCEKCSRKLRHCKSGARVYTVQSLKCIQRIQQNWPKHTRTGICFVFELYTQQSRGGPQCKPKVGRPKATIAGTHTLPFSLSDDNIFHHLSDAQRLEYPISFEVIGHQWEQSLFICSICLCILGKPSVQTPCQHNFCAQCLTQCFKHSSSPNINCPVCNTHVQYSNIT